MLDAVLFDWGDTLMRWSPSDGMLEAGHAAGFAAIGREPSAGITDRFRDAYITRFFTPGVLEEVEYPAEVRALLAEFGEEVDDEEDGAESPRDRATLPQRDDKSSQRAAP